jgi:integrase
VAKRSDHLLYHRKKWYFKLSIPRSMQHLFLSDSGKPMGKIVESLSSTPEIAELKARQREAECAAVFAQIRAGVITTPQQAKLALTRGPAVDEEGNPIFPGYEADRSEQHQKLHTALAEAEKRLENERRATWYKIYGTYGGPSNQFMGRPDLPTAAGETINQASEAWFAELTRDKTAAPRATTLDGHRLRVRAFVDKRGDLLLTEITRAVASDFLNGLDISNRTRNAYATTLRSVFECARRRGRFQGDNPFDGMKAKVVGSSYQPFTVDELQKLFDAMPRDVAPKRHSPDSALPWAALIALYSGARLEEIAQLTTADVREEAANGATVTVIDVHNGGQNKLKNETSARLIPMHSALVHAGLLDYVKALKAGPLFPGLKRRTSKGGKVGARLGELFRKRLVALGLKREGLCFHSFRHTVAGRLDAAGVPQSDAARVLGHAVAGMSYGTYSQGGPGLKRVAATVEQISYEGLRLVA